MDWRDEVAQAAEARIGALSVARKALEDQLRGLDVELKQARRVLDDVRPAPVRGRGSRRRMKPVEVPASLS